jgi:hypothetical protein
VSISWSGYEWQTRDGGKGSPGAAEWSSRNVQVTPEGLVLKLTNPTGAMPVGAEILSDRQGFGYGTYECVVEKRSPRLSAMHKSIVFGGMFTYEDAVAPGHQEIDMCESSAWGGGPAQDWEVQTNHSLWLDARLLPGEGNIAESWPTPSSAVQSHRTVWGPGRIVCESHDGEGFGDRLVWRTVIEDQRVPTPQKERVHFNFWVFDGGHGDPLRTLERDEVLLRSFSFTPLDDRTTVTSPPVGKPHADRA